MSLRRKLKGAIARITAPLNAECSDEQRYKKPSFNPLPLPDGADEYLRTNDSRLTELRQRRAAGCSPFSYAPPVGEVVDLTVGGSAKQSEVWLTRAAARSATPRTATTSTSDLRFVRPPDGLHESRPHVRDVRRRPALHAAASIQAFVGECRSQAAARATPTAARACVRTRAVTFSKRVCRQPGRLYPCPPGQVCDLADGRGRRLSV